MNDWEVRKLPTFKLKPKPLAPGLATLGSLPMRVDAQSDSTGLTLTGQIDFRNGRLGFVEMTVTSAAGHVTGDGLRSIPVGDIVRAVAWQIVATVEPLGNGAVKIAPMGYPPAGGPGRGPNAEQIAHTAQLYRFAKAVGDPPTKAVAESFDVSMPTATRWVARARAEGLLEDEDARVVEVVYPTKAAAEAAAEAAARALGEGLLENEGAI